MWHRVDAAECCNWLWPSDLSIKDHNEDSPAKLRIVRISFDVKNWQHARGLAVSNWKREESPHGKYCERPFGSASYAAFLQILHHGSLRKTNGADDGRVERKWLSFCIKPHLQPRIHYTTTVSGNAELITAVMCGTAGSREPEQVFLFCCSDSFWLAGKGSINVKAAVFNDVTDLRV